MSLMEMSLSGGVLITAAALLRRTAWERLPGELFPVLWRLILLRLLVPFRLKSPFSVYTGAGQDLGVTALFPQGPAPGLSGSDVPVQTLIWAAGAAAMGLYFLAAALRWHRKFSGAQPVETPFIARWRSAHPLRRRLRVCRSGAVASPLSRGLLRPVILLPDREVGEETLGYVLEHEYVHIRRWDQVTKLTALAALCVHWFNPLVWLLVRLLDRDLERSCDRAVLRRLGPGARTGYARTLLDMEEAGARHASVCSYFSGHPLEERICAIMKTRKISVTATALAVLVLLAVTMAFAAPAVEPAVPAENSRPVTVLADSRPHWTWPCPGGTVSLGYGDAPGGFCDHICIAAPRGTAILAALAGTVEETGFDTRAGNYVVLSHGDGLRTSYQHLLEVTVTAGESVSAGERLGAQGATGMATGPCLAFAVQENGETVDPMQYFS